MPSKNSFPAEYNLSSKRKRELDEKVKQGIQSESVPKVTPPTMKQDPAIPAKATPKAEPKKTTSPSTQLKNAFTGKTTNSGVNRFKSDVGAAAKAANGAKAPAQTSKPGNKKDTSSQAAKTTKKSTATMTNESLNKKNTATMTSKKIKKKSDTKATLKKAFNAEEAMKARREKAMQGRKPFNAVEAMKARREKAMANRDPSKNPNNVNLRGIVKKKGKKG